MKTRVLDSSAEVTVDKGCYIVLMCNITLLLKTVYCILCCQNLFLYYTIKIRVLYCYIIVKSIRK